MPIVLLLVPELRYVWLGQLGLGQVKVSCLKVTIYPLAMSVPGSATRVWGWGGDILTDVPPRATALGLSPVMPWLGWEM